MTSRPKPALAAWIARERKRLGLKPPELAARLIALGLEASEQTVRVWESYANRRPSQDNIDGLERIFGTRSPDQAASSPADIGILVAVISELVSEMRLARERDQDAAAAMMRAAEALLSAQRPGAGEASTEPAAPLVTAR